MRKVEYIRITNPNNNNVIHISMPVIVDSALDSPRYLLFNESDRSIRIPTLNSQRVLKVDRHSQSACVISPGTVISTPEEFIGNWSYEIEDMTVYLIDRIS